MFNIGHAGKYVAEFIGLKKWKYMRDMMGNVFFISIHIPMKNEFCWKLTSRD